MKPNLLDLESLATLGPADIQFWIALAFYCIVGWLFGMALSTLVDWLNKDEDASNDEDF